jgi:8-oxo-dGTP pyrophosphatase MutT (NUDIX family)
MKSKQIAALPYRVGNSGPKVLLITTRNKGRWSIPKGWPMKGRKARSAAAIEAFQEAGVVGRVGRRPLGRFKHCKEVGEREIECAVDVFPLEVKRKLNRWPEKRERARRWFSVEQAARKIRKKGLRRVIAACHDLRT